MPMVDRHLSDAEQVGLRVNLSQLGAKGNEILETSSNSVPKVHRELVVSSQWRIGQHLVDDMPAVQLNLQNL